MFPILGREQEARLLGHEKKKKKKEVSRGASIAVILVKFASFGSKMGDIPLNWRRWSVLPAYLASCMYIYVIYDILNLPTYL